MFLTFYVSIIIDFAGKPYPTISGLIFLVNHRSIHCIGFWYTFLWYTLWTFCWVHIIGRCLNFDTLHIKSRYQLSALSRKSKFSTTLFVLLLCVTNKCNNAERPFCTWWCHVIKSSRSNCLDKSRYMIIWSSLGMSDPPISFRYWLVQVAIRWGR